MHKMIRYPVAVMAVLLGLFLVFVVVTSIWWESSPENRKSQAPEGKPTIVNTSPQAILSIASSETGTYEEIMMLEEKRVSMPDLLTVLQHLPSPEEVLLVVRADASVPHHRIVRAMDIARKAGITRLGFVRSKETPQQD